MTPPWFAVTGTGRCGTGYMSAVFRQHDLNCGHENWWTADSKRVRPDLDGDSSWLALPAIEAGDWSGPVIHVVRHPVAVVRSFVALGFPDWLSLPQVPELTDLPQPDLAVEYWVQWNVRCAAVADLTSRIEDVPHRLDHVSRVVGHPLVSDRVARVPMNVNSRRRADVHEAAIWQLLDGRAEQFGYAP